MIDSSSELVDEASVFGSGIGGMSRQLEIDGVPVFAKQISLTDLERRPENVMSTANVFGLPTFCQYGVGSPGFGAWRDLAANALTTGRRQVDVASSGRCLHRSLGQKSVGRVQLTSLPYW